MHMPAATRTRCALFVLVAAAGATLFVSLSGISNAAPSARAAGSSIRVTYVSAQGTVSAGKQAGLYAACPKGSYAIGGGGTSANGVELLDSAPYQISRQSYGGPADAWVSWAGNTTSKSATYWTYAVCASGITVTSTASSHAVGLGLPKGLLHP